MRAPLLCAFWSFVTCRNEITAHPYNNEGLRSVSVTLGTKATRFTPEDSICPRCGWKQFLSLGSLVSPSVKWEEGHPVFLYMDVVYAKCRESVNLILNELHLLKF